MRGAVMMSGHKLLAADPATLAGPEPGRECAPPGPPQQPAKGPPVFLDMDQAELDSAYRQADWQPNGAQVTQRLASRSLDTRARLGHPERLAYGPTPVERMDLYLAPRDGAPIFVYVHGGSWRFLEASTFGYPAEMFHEAGAHYLALDFADVREVGGDLTVLASQVRNAIAWIHRNAASFGGDPGRIHIGGHSSGGHLAAVALVTDWEGGFGLPADTVKGGLCMSGMFDLAPVRLSWRSAYLDFTDAIEAAMSPQRHLGRLTSPVIVAYGTSETPEFQRQSRDFAAAIEAAGKPVELIPMQACYHNEVAETLGNPYTSTSRAVLAQMGLTRPL